LWSEEAPKTARIGSPHRELGGSPRARAVFPPRGSLAILFSSFYSSDRPGPQKPLTTTNHNHAGRHESHVTTPLNYRLANGMCGCRHELPGAPTSSHKIQSKALGRRLVRLLSSCIPISTGSCHIADPHPTSFTIAVLIPNVLPGFGVAACRRTGSFRGTLGLLVFLVLPVSPSLPHARQRRNRISS
jgi:hypothetical protein